MSTKSFIDSISNNPILKPIEVLIKEINLAGYLDSRIERALDLPKGLLELFKNYKLVPKPEDLALFRILNKYPQMIELAECGYDLNKFYGKIKRTERSP